jgi:hypothetical protein
MRLETGCGLKIYRNWFSLWGFSRVIYPKILVSCVCDFGFLVYASATCLVDYSTVILVDKMILF